jgi:hypothetical protein
MRRIVRRGLGGVKDWEGCDPVSLCELIDFAPTAKVSREREQNTYESGRGDLPGPFRVGSATRHGRSAVDFAIPIPARAVGKRIGLRATARHLPQL